MKTVKQISDLTGISVRMLHYYDEINLLKPSAVTKAGYRLYDDKALENLQQILFFKELDLPLKEIKEIITSPHFDKMKALESHKNLIILKRDRLNNLIELINKTLKGEDAMSFKEFDMTEYYNLLEEFKKENKDKVIKTWKSIDKFDEMINQLKANESTIAENAIKQYGSIEKFTEAMKKDLNNDKLIAISEGLDKFKKDCIYDRHPKLKELYKSLTSNLNENPNSKEIQEIAKEITYTAKKDYEIFNMDKGDERLYYMTKDYLLNQEWLEIVDTKYGKGSAKFIGEVFKVYFKDKKPKLEILYEKLAYDLSKDPTSKEIQQIVEEIANTTKINNEFYKGDTGLNYKGFFSTMANIYLSNANKDINIVDNNYGKGASKFIGDALKFYAENIN